jgi:tetratricopeptide (TPR) repeat protein
MFGNHRLLKVAGLRFVYEGALADYNQALTLNPRYAEVYANRGMLRLWLNKTSEAEADFAQCVALKPEMKSSLEQRINQLQAQLKAQIRTPGH